MNGSERSRWAVIGAAIAILGGVVVGATAAVRPVSAAADWDFVYGDPGPANYSRYQDVEIAPDGTTYMAGFFSGHSMA